MTYDASNATRPSSIGSVNRILLVGMALASGFLLIVLALGITSDDGVDPLDGTAWRLEVLIVDGQEAPVIEGTSPSIAFDGDTVQGSGGCNTFSGSYETDGDTISIGALATTEIFCEEPTGSFDQEMAYLSQLTRASGFRVEADRLVLSDDSADLLVFGP